MNKLAPQEARTASLTMHAQHTIARRYNTGHYPQTLYKLACGKLGHAAAFQPTNKVNNAAVASQDDPRGAGEGER